MFSAPETEHPAKKAVTITTASVTTFKALYFRHWHG
jgi:hypothetical protein